MSAGKGDWKNNPRYKGLLARHVSQKTHGLCARGDVNPRYVLFQSVKKRARECGIEFDLDFSDLPDNPLTCPVLGIEIHHSRGIVSHGSPSLDRIDPSLGYTKDNVRIISYRANLLKSNATSDEIHKVLLDIVDIEKSEVDNFSKS